MPWLGFLWSVGAGASWGDEALSSRSQRFAAPGFPAARPRARPSAGETLKIAVTAPASHFRSENGPKMSPKTAPAGSKVGTVFGPKVGTVFDISSKKMLKKVRQNGSTFLDRSWSSRSSFGPIFGTKNGAKSVTKMLMISVSKLSPAAPPWSALRAGPRCFL